ncbi:hypothetical protein GF325_19335, partial [Candidatus Bathyarchaeota archaeon]|nr:hypothetical protein [Candidatus Bathyarchaeota archaeon]
MAADNIDIIITFLESTDPGTQSTALKRINQILNQKNDIKDEQDKLLPFLKKELRTTNSPILTEVVETICLIGRKNPTAIEELVPDLVNEIKRGNRYRARIFLEYLADKGGSREKAIKQQIDMIINHALEWFKDSHLTPILLDFLDRATGKSKRFLKFHGKKIRSLLDSLPPEMASIRELLE